jgi:hypothetical protein
MTLYEVDIISIIEEIRKLLQMHVELNRNILSTYEIDNYYLNKAKELSEEFNIENEIVFPYSN